MKPLLLIALLLTGCETVGHLKDVKQMDCGTDNCGKPR